MKIAIVAGLFAKRNMNIDAGQGIYCLMNIFGLYLIAKDWGRD